MTKPVTGVALLTLYEQGMFRLNDPVERFLPEFAGLRVAERDADGTRRLVDPERPMTVRDAMMHMSGIGYGPEGARLDFSKLGTTPPGSRMGKGATLQTLVERLGEAPLVSHPGTRWLYAWSTDVCARLVEVISGQRFDDYLRRAIFEPLGMRDTDFWVHEDAADRLAALYGRNARKELVLLDDPETSRLRRPTTFLSGGGGLVGTAGDYLRFVHMLANGGVLDGVRVLASRTVALMASNHLPGGGDLRSVVMPGGYGEVGFDGMGFGLTVAVGLGPVATQSLSPAGEVMWGGGASTGFLIEPPAGGGAAGRDGEGWAPSPAGALPCGHGTPGAARDVGRRRQRRRRPGPGGAAAGGRVGGRRPRAGVAGAAVRCGGRAVPGAGPGGGVALAVLRVRFVHLVVGHRRRPVG